MSKITKIKAREILDSRGVPTVEVELFLNDGKKVWSSVPSGASTGEFEACELRDGDQKRYFGKGVLKAVENIEKIIASALIGQDPVNQSQIDKKMIELDGSDNKKNLGANAILAVSMAVCRAGALSSGRKLFEHISFLSEQDKKIPRPFFNVINGGRHAGNKVAFQEFMISPSFESFAQNYKAAAEIYQVLKKLLKERFGGASTLLGDEGGFAPNDFSREDEVLEILKEAVLKAGYEEKVDMALDVAASEFYDSESGLYNLGFKTDTEDLKSKEEMIELYQALVEKHPIVSIEDPFDQSDFDAFADLKSKVEKYNVQVVGDDLTVTNPLRIQKAIEKGSCSALLLKLNQIGTVTEAIESAKKARQAGWKIMVSHRSGETTDDFIADFAVGIGAEQIKSGATARGERVCKYNRILAIEEVLKEGE